MKTHLKKTIAPALLIVVLTTSLVTTYAQRRRAAQPTQTTNATQTSTTQNGTGQTQARRGPRGPGNQNSTGGNTKGQPHRVQQATLTAAQIEAVRRTDALKDIVSINGRTISPRPGVSLLQFPSGGYAIVTGATNQGKPGGYAAQLSTWNLPNGHLRFAACWCNGRRGQDNCKFVGSYDAAHCRGQQCCGFASGEMDQNGNVVALDQ